MNPAGACALLAAAVVLLWPGRRPSPLQPAQPSVVSPGRGPFGRGRGRSSGEAEAAAVMAALGPGLRAGLTPAAVLSVLSEGDPSVAGRPPLVDALEQAARRGAPLGPVWLAEADRLASAPLRLMAQAWMLSEQLGAPMAGTAAAASTMAREALAGQRQLAAALAAPRATMRLLTALPLAGPLLAAGLGVPASDLLGSSAAQASLLAGGVLLLAGRRWTTRMVAAVEAGPRR